MEMTRPPCFLGPQSVTRQPAQRKHHGTSDLNMLRIARNEQHDCSGFARLRRSRKHVWHQAKELMLMDAHLVEATIETYLTEIRNRLDKAAGIGRAADACAGLTLKAKNDHLQKVASTRDFTKAISEFVWNALDADEAKTS